MVHFWESWIIIDNWKLGWELALGVGSSCFSKILHLKFKEEVGVKTGLHQECGTSIQP